MTAGSNLPARNCCPVCDSQNLKPHGDNRYQCRACHTAFAKFPRTCVVCGNEIAHGRRKNTCCDECEKTKIRDTQLQHYHKQTMEDPLYHVKKYQQKKANPRSQEVARRQQKKKWEKIKSNPELLEKEKERLRALYAAQSKEIQEKRKKVLLSLSPEELEAKKEAARQAMRKYSKYLRAEMKNNPELHQRNLDKQAEWRGKRKLAELISVGSELDKRLNKQKGNDNDAT